MEQERFLPSELLKQLPIFGNHSVLQAIKCKDGNNGFYVCFQNECQKYPFMCNNKKCVCRKDHEKCMLKSEVEEFIQKLQQKVVNLTSLLEHHNQIVNNYVQEIVKYANEMKTLFKAQVNRKCKQLSFSPQELDILVKIQQNKVSGMKGKDFFKVYSKIKQKKKDQTSFDQEKQINQMSLRWKSIQVKIFDQFKAIRAIWDQNKNQKCLYSKNVLKNSQEKELTKSSIVTTAEQYKIISGFFNRRIKLELLYKASQNDFKVAKFHQLCDGISNTLVLIQTQFNKKIGGFTPLKWKQNMNPLRQNFADSTNQTFLFSLTHNEKLTQKDLTMGISTYVNFGPIFGNLLYNGLLISDTASQNSVSQTNFSQCFVHPNYTQSNQNTIQRFTGNPNTQQTFKTKQWQVWHVIYQQ